MRKVLTILALFLTVSSIGCAAGQKRQQSEEENALRRTEGNIVKLFDNGSDFYKDLSAAIENAKHYICFEYYSVGQDSVSNVVLSLLERKAAEGVAVYAMLDNYGSRHRDFPIDSRAIADYRARGFDIAIFNPRKISNPLPRDHRKLTIIDGQTAFVGGMNINDLYVHGSEALGQVRDYTLRIEGPAAAVLQRSFERSWSVWSDRPQTSFPEPPESTAQGCTAVTVCPTEGWEIHPTVSDNYLNLIGTAQKSIVLTNAYMMPSAPIVRALKAAAKRGVKVDITIGAKTDLPSMLEKRPHRILNNLQKQDNITVQIVEDTFFHAKVLSIDSKLLLLGSANLDYLSRTTNFELCVIVEDQEIASRFESTL